MITVLLFCGILIMATLAIILAAMRAYCLPRPLHIVVSACAVAVKQIATRICYGALTKRFTSATGIG